MSTTLQIAEVARRSGFTPATLRYYEDIGLLTPPGRTDGGYRLYDETSLERLRFITRAKQLGCSLDEIADLASVWDGGRCATVQERLRTTVEAKVADAHAQIAAMTTLAAELQRAAASLSTDPVDGPATSPARLTDDPAPASTEASVPLVAKADAHDDDDLGAVPIACTLGAGQMANRLDEWAALLADKRELLRGVAARRALDDGLRLEFARTPTSPRSPVSPRPSRGCCRFFDFALVIDGRGIALEVHAPADAQPVLTALFGAAD